MLARDKFKLNCSKFTKFSALGLISLFIFIRWNSHIQDYSKMATTDQLSNFVIPHSGVKVPKIIYGTAWKKEKTQKYVHQALTCGFRGIDTAGQPRHYDEKLVGDAITQFLNESNLKREELFIQTKFSPADGQDRNTIPYDPSLPLKDQVHKSFESSLKNLNVKVIDSYILHSPLKTYDHTIEVWQAMEELKDKGAVRQIGISNIYDFGLLKNLWNHANTKPAVIQNRFDAFHNNFDEEIRKFCRDNNIVYQSFWTLTATKQRAILTSVELTDLARNEYKVTPEQLLLKVVMNLGVVPLVGTTDQLHMKHDLDLLHLKILDKDQFFVMKLLGISS
jgi:diketogulonate reductase-like aldo/keto reductase